MIVTVIPSDKAIYVDGNVLFFDFECSDNIHAIQWKDENGIIEYKYHSKTEEFSDINVIQYFIDVFNAEKTRIDEEETVVSGEG